MVHFARIDSQIRANRLIRTNRLKCSQIEPPFLRIAFGALQKLRIAGLRRFARIVQTL